MVDKVRPLKIENPANGGDELDFMPTEMRPDEDFAAVKGIAFENSDNTTIEGDSGVMKFKDVEVTTPLSLKQITERPFSFTNIVSSSLLTVPLNQQMIVFEEITISGELVLEGDLVLIDDGSL